jgi:hypothetical protein
MDEDFLYVYSRAHKAAAGAPEVVPTVSGRPCPYPCFRAYLGLLIVTGALRRAAVKGKIDGDVDTDLDPSLETCIIGLYT